VTGVQTCALPICGLLLFDENDNPIGMVSYSNYDNTQITIVPISIISKFAKDFKFKSMLTSVFFQSNILEAVYNNKQLICHQILKTYELSYVTNNKKKFKFKENDIILKINHKNFTDDGKIFHEEIGFDLEVYTYCMFESFNNTIIELVLLRNEKEMAVCINGLEINSFYNLRFCNNNIYYKWKSYIFTELSEELFYELYNEKIINIDFLDYKKIKQNSEKLVIMFDKNSVKIIEKIGNKQINSLIDVKNYTINKEKLNCTFNINKTSIKYSL
jgi:hypothetical protein